MKLDPHLETSIRAALAARSADITPASLGQPQLRSSGRRRTKPFLLAAASVIAVVLIVVGGGLWLAPRADRSATPQQVFDAGYIGSEFRLTTVVDDGKTWAIPAALGVTVEFTRKGEIYLNDSVNVQTGSTSETVGGFVVRDVVSSAVGSIDTGTAQWAAVQAIGALVHGPAAASGTFAPATVHAQLTGDLLTLTASDFRLTLVRIGPARTAPAQSPTPPTTASSVDQCSLPQAERTGGWTCYGTAGNMPALSSQLSAPALATTTANEPAPTSRNGTSSTGFELPDTSNGRALLIRTDFSNDTIWKAVVAEALKNQPMPGMPVNAENVYYNLGLHVVDDRRFEGMTMKELLEVAPDPTVPTDQELSHPTGDPDIGPLRGYIADTETMTNPDHPILAVNYYLDRGQHFRLIPKAMAAVEINLSIANLGFDDYISAAGPDGIVRD